jgi:NAD(P)-dependent dehydrogenase (short-subunit alcohol dehydrogenase family)
LSVKINVLGTILATKEAVKHFAPNGDCAINLSSIASAGVPGVAICSGSKSSVDAITRRLVAELGPRKIRVNATCRVALAESQNHRPYSFASQAGENLS